MKTYGKANGTCCHGDISRPDVQYWGLSCMCAWPPPSGWFLLVRAGSFPSRAEWCHICPLWVPPPGWVCYYKLCFFMILVDFCLWLCLYLFTDSTRCHILRGRRPWFCICDRFQLGKTYLWQGQEASWDSAWGTSTSADHQLCINY